MTWRKYKKFIDWEYPVPLKLVRYHEYVLVVPDIHGQVNGIYFNHSYNKSAVIRKLRKMIGSKLKIKIIDLTYHEWREQLTSI